MRVTWHSPFWNAEQGRLRTLWRLLLFLALFTLCAWVWHYALLFVQAPLTRLQAALPSPVFPLSGGYLGSVLALFSALAICGPFCDRRSLRDYGYHLDRSWWVEVLAGAGIASVAMVATFLVAWAAGWVTVEAVGWQDPRTWVSLGAWLVAFIIVSLQEETLVRGYLLRNLAEGLSTPAWGARGGVLAAWIATSLLFGLLHLGNPNASGRAAAFIAVGGLWFGLGYLLTGELALPIGLHTGWNFFEGPILGLAVSGIQITPYPLIHSRATGPEIWTGGAFGPEDGLLGLLAVGIGVALTVWWAHRRGYRLHPEAFRPPKPSRPTSLTV